MSRFILKRKLYAFINPAAIGSAIKNTGTAVMNVAKPLSCRYCCSRYRWRYLCN